MSKKEMTFKDAALTIIPFGKYRGEIVDDVAQDDDGLLYLDWLADQDWIYGDVAIALEVYLEDEAIAADVKELKNNAT